MRIIVDLDNTILDSFQAVLQIYREQTCFEPLPLENPVQGDILAYCPLFDQQRSGACFKSERFFEIVKPFEGAIHVLERLSEQGHEIIVASLHQHPQEAKRRWVTKYLPFVKEVYLIDFEDHRLIDKSMVLGDVIIDDNVLALTTSPAAYKICFNYYYGYNSHWSGVSFNQWGKELIHYLDQLDDEF